MVKIAIRLILLAAVIGVASAGFFANLFWFGCSVFVSAFTTIVANCPTNTAACAAGAFQATVSALTLITGGAGVHYNGWRRDGPMLTPGQKIYHIYEDDLRLVAPDDGMTFRNDLAAANRKKETTRGELGPTVRLADHFKLVHVDKANEAFLYFHHSNGDMRQMRYHFNNETKTHQIHAHFLTTAQLEEQNKAEEDDPSKREQVDINTGWGTAYNDLDASDWDTVNHASQDIAYWTSHSIQQLRDNNADSFCMGYQDPNRNNENVMAMRLQPANPNTYQGVNFDRCGSDNFRRASSVPASSAALVKVASDFTTEKAREMRIALKRRLGMITERGSGDSQMETSKRTTAGTLLSPVEERADGFCYELDCDTSDDCALFGCPNIDCNTASHKCSERPPECTLHTC